MKTTGLQRLDPFTPGLLENPFGLLRRLTGDMEQFFDVPTFRLLSPEVRRIAEAAWIPSVDVFEKDGTFVVRADLPGLTKDDVDIQVTDDAIAIRGERKKEIEEEKEGLYRAERAYGSFYRAIPLPEGIKAEDVKATFKNGVLEVAAPLPPAAKAAPKSHRVPVQEGTSEPGVKSAA